MHGSPIPACDISLGIIAGGRATRLGGIDKAWLVRNGEPQVLRWRRRFAAEVRAVLVSANRDLERYVQHGLTVVEDRISGDSSSSQFSSIGPIAALDALSHACATPWLMTLPVDLIEVNDCLLRTLIADRGDDGAFVVDADGVQPLVALWRRDGLRAACNEVIAAGGRAAHALQARLDMRSVVLSKLRFGNLNTPEDLAAAGIALSDAER